TRLPARQQRELQPLPVTVDVGESDFTQPLKLRFNVQQLVRGVFTEQRNAEPLEEALVQGRRRRSDVFQVAEDTARREQAEHLGVERALAFVDQVMNGEARHHRVKHAQDGQRQVEV